MNQYIFLQRITGPAMILTFGVTALLDQWHVLRFGKSWPLYLIVLGILKLAQRAALVNAEPPYPPPGYPPQYAGHPPVGNYPPAASGSSPDSPTFTSSGESTTQQGSNSGEGR